jgi:methylenetetrahydrofolate dehydrogenase (NADP+)/methenyltetrahydrofolate cyclohydrolase
MEIVFAMDLAGETPDKALADREPELALMDGLERAFVADRVTGVAAHREAIDRVLDAISPEWKVARMAAVDRAILRLAAWELMHAPDVPPAVAVDEAVRLAKGYSTEDSARFVNGLLGTLAGPPDRPPARRRGRAAPACARPRGPETVLVAPSVAPEQGQARLLLGGAQARRRREAVAAAVAARVAAGGRRPLLLTVAARPDGAASSYLTVLEGQVRRAGFATERAALDPRATPRDAVRAVRRLAEREDVDAVVLSWPLPPALHPEALVEAVPPAKDVDALSPYWLGRLAVDPAARAPATARAVLALLAQAGVALEGRRVTLIGRGRTVGLGTALLLMHAGATLTVAHRPTRDLADAVRGAEVVISAAGVPGLVTAPMVAPGAVVVDVGTTERHGGIVGDVDPAVRRVASALAPVPGGVGPLTVACLLENCLAAVRS